MQVGAAFAVLQASEADGATPLELLAAKTHALHTEPAAGAVGLAAALQRLLQLDGEQAMLHLRTLNPHVASIVQVSAQAWHVRARATNEGC